MKQSNYNYFYYIDDGILAYNARTNAMAVLEMDDFEHLKQILQGNLSSKQELVDELRYGGFIIEDNINEIEIIRHDMYASRFTTSQLTLTIAPTSDCNFRCPYCYEKDVLHLQSMTNEVADKIVDFVKVKSLGIEHFNVTWYGGEPLLEFDRIVDLSKRFIEICENNLVKYNATMVTNGYLLTKERLRKLIDYKVSSIQITLDGDRETHDKRRYLKNHTATFDKIISNLLSFESLSKELKNFPRISIRMNIDRENKKEAFQLLNFIANSPLGKYVVPYVAAVYIPSDSTYEKTLKNNEYYEFRNEFNEESKRLGFQIDNLVYYPRRITSNCCCDRSDSMVIDAEGNMYKCWEEIGNKEVCIGKIDSKEIYHMPKIYYDYLLFDPTMDEKCSKCRILPVCMGGGCPSKRRRDKRQDCEIQLNEFNRSIQKSAFTFGKNIIQKIEL